ncbi:hypothetical protein EV383_4372 [Pseudonocardia sediminis]|uniref:LtfC/p132/Gp6 beta-sandwich domain-containing protein n=1 Tax=Pseudonocardia sediminis TaxID=1397368 RepID=A0A4Q7V1X6_PSEST|nr:hypothetical protein [Pseudonocardia sediminis]RZT87448.1 hypothetical protein EV383_4372 [Pseudonocardia sediminis]
MTLSLGYQPQALTVYLSKDSWFTASVVNDDDLWPQGSSAELRLTSSGSNAPIVWAAAVDGASFTWSVSPSQVNAAVAAGMKQARLFYIRDGRPELWGKGSVVYA